MIWLKRAGVHWPRVCHCVKFGQFLGGKVKVLPWMGNVTTASLLQREYFLFCESTVTNRWSVYEDYVSKPLAGPCVWRVKTSGSFVVIAWSGRGYAPGQSVIQEEVFLQHRTEMTWTLSSCLSFESFSSILIFTAMDVTEKCSQWWSPNGSLKSEDRNSGLQWICDCGHDLQKVSLNVGLQKWLWYN